MKTELTPDDVGKWFVTKGGNLVQIKRFIEGSHFCYFYSDEDGADGVGTLTKHGFYRESLRGARDIDWKASARVGEHLLAALITVYPQLEPMRDVLIEDGSIVEALQ